MPDEFLEFFKAGDDSDRVVSRPRTVVVRHRIKFLAIKPVHIFSPLTAFLSLAALACPKYVEV